jgi:hypothetical protein
MEDSNGQTTTSNSLGKILPKHRGVTVDNSGSQDDNGCEVDSEDGDTEGDSDTTGDTDGSGSDAIGDYWGIDESESYGSSCDESCLDWCKFL